MQIYYMLCMHHRAPFILKLRLEQPAQEPERIRLEQLSFGVQEQGHTTTRAAAARHYMSSRMKSSGESTMCVCASTLAAPKQAMLRQVLRGGDKRETRRRRVSATGCGGGRQRRQRQGQAQKTLFGELQE